MMTRTMIRPALVLLLLWGTSHDVQASGADRRPEIPLREIAADSLQRLAAGSLRLYAAGDELWLEIPPSAIRLTVQIDRGAGMRNRPLQTLPPFRLEADPEAGVARIGIDDTLRNPGFDTAPLPLARMAGTKRLLARIDRKICETGHWYDCRGGILRRQRPGPEIRSGVFPTRHGVLLQIRTCYDVESPERSTEIQMPSGALPLELGILLETVSEEPETPERRLVVSDLLPKEYAEALSEAVDRYNRSHRRAKLHLESGGETLPLTLPFGLSFDGMEERITTFVRRQPTDQTPEFIRIGLGSATWEDAALQEALLGSTSYGELRRLLTHPQERRRSCLRKSLLRTLNELFDPEPQAIAATPTERRLRREFLQARKRIERWERFMRRDAGESTGSDTELPNEALYEAMLARTRQLCTQLAADSHGSPQQREILDWIVRGMIADGEGRFSTPQLRLNARCETPQKSLRRQTALWESLLPHCTAETLAAIPELFERRWIEKGSAAFTVQDAFISAVAKQSSVEARLAPTIAALERLYARHADDCDPDTAIFARLERQRLRDLQNPE